MISDLPLAFFDREHGRQGIVLDGNRFDRFRQRVAIRMGQQKNRLFRMVDHAIREARLIVFDQRDIVFPGNVLRGDDDKLAPVDFGPEGYLLDFAAWDAAADRGAIEHARQRDVVNVPCSSRDFVAPFLSRRGQADDAIVLHVKLGTNIWEKLKCGPKEFFGLSIL